MDPIFARDDKLEDGHYTILQELGVGGMGVVYHCKDEFLQRDVAIKMLLPELLADSKNVEVFTQEARLAAHLEHPNIVTIYDIGVESRSAKRHHFVAMEYLPGGNLGNRTQSGALPVEHALNWMKQLANGLNFAHKKGVIHQDIKADNIFITTDGDLKIGDFGLARLMANKVYINPSTKGMGTPAYMSPELCRGEQQDQRSDIYSLGVLFFEMATGQLPFRANGMIEMAMKHTTAPIPSVRRINPRVPDVLDRLIRKMMEKVPSDRHQTLGEVIKILDDLIFELRLARMGLSKKTTPTPDSEVEPAEPPEKKQTVKPAAEKKQEAEPPIKGPPPKSNRVDLSVPISLPPPKTEPSSKADAGKTTAARGKSDMLLTDTVAGYTDKAQTADKGSPKAESTATTGKAPDGKGTLKTSQKIPDGKPGGAGTQAPKSGSAVLKDDGGIAKEGISYPKDSIAKAGIKIPEQVGPVRHSQEIKLPQGQPKISAYSIPVVEGLNPLLTEKWTFRTHGPIGWSSHPVLSRDEAHVFITSTDGRVYKLDINDGTRVWEHDTESLILSSPVLKGNDVYVATTDGHVMQLSAHGQRVWRTNLSDGVVATPALSTRSLLVATMSGKFVSLDTATGDKYWEYNAGAPIVGDPSFYGDVAMVGTRQGKVHCVEARMGRKVWTATLDGPVVTAPATSVDSIYIGTQAGTFYALDFETGQQVWEYQTGRGIISSAQIVFTSVVFCSQDKWLYCCEKYDGSLKWKSAVRGRVQSPLAIASHTIIAVSREGWIQGFDAASGKLTFQKNFGKRLESMPLILKYGMLVASVEGDVTYYAFGKDTLKKSA